MSSAHIDGPPSGCSWAHSSRTDIETYALPYQISCMQHARMHAYVPTCPLTSTLFCCQYRRAGHAHWSHRHVSSHAPAHPPKGDGAPVTGEYPHRTPDDRSTQQRPRERRTNPESCHPPNPSTNDLGALRITAQTPETTARHTDHARNSHTPRSAQEERSLDHSHHGNSLDTSPRRSGRAAHR